MNQEYVQAGESVYRLRKTTSREGEASRYRVQITVGHTYPEGRQRQHDYTGRNAEEIQYRINRSLSYSDDEMRLFPNNITVEDMMNRWLEYKRSGVTEEYLNHMRKKIQYQILPFLGSLEIQKLTADRIEEWEFEHYDRFGSMAQIQIVGAFLRDAVKLMIRQGYLLCNVFTEIQSGEVQVVSQSVLNRQQAEIVIRRRLENSYYGAFATMLGTGMRVSECIGLSWDHVDREQRLIRVCQQLDKLGRIHGTKNGRSRCFPVPDFVWDVLDNEERRQQEWLKLNPDFRNEHNLVFTNHEGGELKQFTLNRKLHSMLMGTPHERLSLHSLRRTFASAGTEMGGIYAVQFMLDHLGMSTTIRYVHPFDKDLAHLANSMGNHFSSILREAEKEYNSRNEDIFCSRP